MKTLIIIILMSVGIFVFPDNYLSTDLDLTTSVRNAQHDKNLGVVHDIVREYFSGYFAAKGMHNVFLFVLSVPLVLSFLQKFLWCDAHSFHYYIKFYFLPFFSQKYTIDWDEIVHIDIQLSSKRILHLLPRREKTVLYLKSGERKIMFLYIFGQSKIWINHIVNTLAVLRSDQEREEFLRKISEPEYRDNWLEHLMNKYLYPRTTKSTQGKR